MNVYHVLGAVQPGAEHPSLRAAAATAANGRDRSLTIGLDALPELDAIAMGDVIGALRVVRGAGGTVSLHVTRPDILETLQACGLDRIFTIVSSAPRAGAELGREARRMRRRRLLLRRAAP